MVNETLIMVCYKYGYTHLPIRGSMQKIYEDLDFFSFGILSKRVFLGFLAIYAQSAMMYVIDIIATYNALDISICLFIIDFFIWGYILIYYMTTITLMLFWYYVYVKHIFVYTIDGERVCKIYECVQLCKCARRSADGPPSGRVQCAHDR